jgi:hypothetical protein
MNLIFELTMVTYTICIHFLLAKELLSFISRARGGSSKVFLGGCWLSSRVFLYNSLGGGGRAFK